MPFKMRKITGKDLYKVFNADTGDIKSSGSTKKDAKKQLRLLNKIYKKELKGGDMPADDIKEFIDESYDPKMKDVGEDNHFRIDPSLSDKRVKVYVDDRNGKVVSVHRGSDGWRDWLDNYALVSRGMMKSTGTYKDHEARQKAINKKYGRENVTLIGHSRGGKYVEELNKDMPVNEVITFNKATNWSDIGRNNPANQTDIRTKSDPVSALRWTQRGKGKQVSVKDKRWWNPLSSHGTSSLSRLGKKMIGRGFGSMRVKEMRDFLRDHNKINGIRKAYGKVNKKTLIDEMIKLRPLYGGRARPPPRQYESVRDASEDPATIDPEDPINIPIPAGHGQVWLPNTPENWTESDGESGEPGVDYPLEGDEEAFEQGAFYNSDGELEFPLDEHGNHLVQGLGVPLDEDEIPFEFPIVHQPHQGYETSEYSTTDDEWEYDPYEPAAGGRMIGGMKRTHDDIDTTPPPSPRYAPLESTLRNHITHIIQRPVSRANRIMFFGIMDSLPNVRERYLSAINSGGLYNRRELDRLDVLFNRYVLSGHPDHSGQSITEVEDFDSGSDDDFRGGATTTHLAPFFCRIGSKKPLAKTIIGMMPEHKTYIEPFFGGGAIYWAKPPSDKEVVNDLDKGLIEGYRMLKNATPRTSAYTPPVSEQEYSQVRLGRDTGSPAYKRAVEKMRKFVAKKGGSKEDKLLKKLYQYCNTFSSKGIGKIYRAERGTKKLNRIDEYVDRLKHTTISNEDYKKLLKKYDSKDAFFFLDPPYEASEGLYKDGSFNFGELRGELDKLKGKFLLTLNDSKEIRNIFKGFKIKGLKVRGGGFREDAPIGGGGRKEVIITNY